MDSRNLFYKGNGNDILISNTNSQKSYRNVFNQGLQKREFGSRLNGI